MRRGAARLLRRAPGRATEARLSACRRAVGQATLLERRVLWRLGVGKGHCAEEASAASAAREREGRLRERIGEKCGLAFGPSGVERFYDECLAAGGRSRGLAELCLARLEAAVRCARQLPAP